MIIQLVNYKRYRVSFDIGEDFVEINVDIRSGDEIAEILYKDGSVMEYDSISEGEHRYDEKIDMSYELFNKEKGINRLHDEEWLSRENGKEYAIKCMVDEDLSTGKHPKFAKKSVFISLPMSGREDKEIQKDIADAKQQYLMESGLSESDVYFYNNLDGGKIALKFEKDLAEENGANWIAPPEDKMSLWYLGIALNNLAYCDEAIFYGNWKEARGCMVEYDACVRYDIPRKFYERLDKVEDDLIKKLTDDVNLMRSSSLERLEAKYVLNMLKRQKVDNQTDDNDAQKKCCYREYNKKEPSCTHECDGCLWYI